MPEIVKMMQYSGTTEESLNSSDLEMMEDLFGVTEGTMITIGVHYFCCAEVEELPAGCAALLTA